MSSRSPVALARSAVAAGVLLCATQAHAYCRTTTCDPRTEHCVFDADNCNVSGIKLAWPGRCLSFGTQKDGSPLRQISYDTADHVFRGAFATWMAADCGGGTHPSFEMFDIGAPIGGIECNHPEFNDYLPNASVWMFRDDQWPYYQDNATLGLTTVQYEKGTGVILDADVEINSRDTVITTTDTNIRADLASIATHEAGHFLGLSHSVITSATMFANYSSGSLDIRALHPDDVAGICDAYPPGRNVSACTAPYPPHGFSSFCSGGITDSHNGCSFSTRRADGAEPLALGLMAIALLRRRRRQ